MCVWGGYCGDGCEDGRSLCVCVGGIVGMVVRMGGVCVCVGGIVGMVVRMGGVCVCGGVLWGWL